MQHALQLCADAFPADLVGQSLADLQVGSRERRRRVAMRGSSSGRVGRDGERGLAGREPGAPLLKVDLVTVGKFECGADSLVNVIELRSLPTPLAPPPPSAQRSDSTCANGSLHRPPAF